jgi:hypothetical protein
MQNSLRFMLSLVDNFGVPDLSRRFFGGLRTTEF